MRSLWQDLALRWLGGEGSEALAADGSPFERLALAVEPRAPAFLVERVSEVSHQALLCVCDEEPAEALLPVA